MSEQDIRHGEWTPPREGPGADGRPAAKEHATSAGESGPDPVAELTDQLQQVGAEYANYRKRAERDRQAVAEQARAQVLTALVPALDTVHWAEEHDELTGPLRAVADALWQALSVAGADQVGRVGDRFDPLVHEAVEHHHSSAVEIREPTVTELHRPGYRLGSQVLRPALVAVTEPEAELLDPPAAESDAVGVEDDSDRSRGEG